jgi:hypothetical protein
LSSLFLFHSGEEMKADDSKRVEWAGHIKGWKESGISQRKYCEREGLKWPSFDYWRRHLKELNQPKKVVLGKPLQLVPVKVEGPSVVAKELRLIHASGWELRIPSTMEATWITTLLKTL